MKRFISIQEFLDSFKFEKRLYSSTLRYLYNADYQNGLYIDKSPKSSGTNDLINLLLLYRIAKWATNGQKNPAAIEFYDEEPSLAFASFLKTLKKSNLFIGEESSIGLSEKVLLDKLHIYYDECGKTSIAPFANTIEFVSDNRISIHFTDLSNSGYAIPGQGMGKGKFLGIVVNDFTGSFQLELYNNVLNKKLYEPMDYRLYPEKIHEKPFAIVRCPFLENFKPLTFDDKNIIEINCPPYIKEYLGKSTVMDSYGQWNDDSKSVDYDTFTKEFNIKLIKPMFNPVEPSSIKVDESCIVTDEKEIERLEKESSSKEGRRQALKDVYGLIEHWDYEFLD